MTSPISWFEIPVTDLQRATAFYEATFTTSLRVVEDMRIFPYQLGYPSGCLIKHPYSVPARTGTLVYFDVAKDGVAATLARALEAGGKQIVAQTDIGEHGFIAVVEDTEGNAIGLHQGRT